MVDYAETKMDGGAHEPRSGSNRRSSAVGPDVVATEVEVVVPDGSSAADDDSEVGRDAEDKGGATVGFAFDNSSEEGTRSHRSVLLNGL